MSIDLEEQYDKIYRYCYHKLHHQETAEDITQETFLRFFEHEGYHNIGKELQYLYTIARNLCIDEFRRRPASQLPDTWSENTENVMEEQVLSSLALQNALAILTPDEQEILLLKYVNEAPVSTICRLFSISRFALYRKTAKALNQLKKTLEQEELK